MAFEILNKANAEAPSFLNNDSFKESVFSKDEENDIVTELVNESAFKIKSNESVNYNKS